MYNLPTNNIQLPTLPTINKGSLPQAPSVSMPSLPNITAYPKDKSVYDVASQSTDYNATSNSEYWFDSEDTNEVNSMLDAAAVITSADKNFTLDERKALLSKYYTAKYVAPIKFMFDGDSNTNAAKLLAHNLWTSFTEDVDTVANISKSIASDSITTFGNTDFINKFSTTRLGKSYSELTPLEKIGAKTLSTFSWTEGLGRFAPSYDTGHTLLDLGLEVVTDPLNLVEGGGGILADALAKTGKYADNVSDIAKYIPELSDEAGDIVIHFIRNWFANDDEVIKTISHNIKTNKALREAWLGNNKVKFMSEYSKSFLKALSGTDAEKLLLKPDGIKGMRNLALRAFEYADDTVNNKVSVNIIKSLYGAKEFADALDKKITFVAGAPLIPLAKITKDAISPALKNLISKTRLNKVMKYGTAGYGLKLNALDQFKKENDEVFASLVRAGALTEEVANVEKKRFFIKDVASAICQQFAQIQAIVYCNNIDSYKKFETIHELLREISIPMKDGTNATTFESIADYKTILNNVLTEYPELKELVPTNMLEQLDILKSMEQIKLKRDKVIKLIKLNKIAESSKATSEVINDAAFKLEKHLINTANKRVTSRSISKLQEMSDHYKKIIDDTLSTLRKNVYSLLEMDTDNLLRLKLDLTKEQKITTRTFLSGNKRQRFKGLLQGRKAEAKDLYDVYRHGGFYMTIDKNKQLDLMGIFNLHAFDIYRDKDGYIKFWDKRYKKAIRELFNKELVQFLARYRVSSLITDIRHNYDMFAEELLRTFSNMSELEGSMTKLNRERSKLIKNSPAKKQLKGYIKYLSANLNDAKSYDDLKRIQDKLFYLEADATRDTSYINEDYEQLLNNIDEIQTKRNAYTYMDITNLSQYRALKHSLLAVQGYTDAIARKAVSFEGLNKLDNALNKCMSVKKDVREQGFDTVLKLIQSDAAKNNIVYKELSDQEIIANAKLLIDDVVLDGDLEVNPMHPLDKEFTNRYYFKKISAEKDVIHDVVPKIKQANEVISKDPKLKALFHAHRFSEEDIDYSIALRAQIEYLPKDILSRACRKYGFPEYRSWIHKRDVSMEKISKLREDWAKEFTGVRLGVTRVQHYPELAKFLTYDASIDSAIDIDELIKEIDFYIADNRVWTGATIDNATNTFKHENDPDAIFMQQLNAVSNELKSGLKAQATVVQDGKNYVKLIYETYSYHMNLITGTVMQNIKAMLDMNGVLGDNQIGRYVNDLIENFEQIGKELETTIDLSEYANMMDTDVATEVAEAAHSFVKQQRENASNLLIKLSSDLTELKRIATTASELELFIRNATVSFSNGSIARAFLESYFGHIHMLDDAHNTEAIKQEILKSMRINLINTHASRALSLDALGHDLTPEVFEAEYGDAIEQIYGKNYARKAELIDSILNHGHGDPGGDVALAELVFYKECPERYEYLKSLGIKVLFFDIEANRVGDISKGAINPRNGEINQIGYKFLGDELPTVLRRSDLEYTSELSTFNKPWYHNADFDGDPSIADEDALLNVFAFVNKASDVQHIAGYNSSTYDYVFIADRWKTIYGDKVKQLKLSRNKGEINADTYDINMRALTDLNDNMLSFLDLASSDTTHTDIFNEVLKHEKIDGLSNADILAVENLLKEWNANPHLTTALVKKSEVRKYLTSAKSNAIELSKLLQNDTVATVASYLENTVDMLERDSEGLNLISVINENDVVFENWFDETYDQVHVVKTAYGQYTETLLEEYAMKHGITPEAAEELFSKDVIDGNAVNMQDAWRMHCLYDAIGGDKDYVTFLKETRGSRNAIRNYAQLFYAKGEHSAINIKKLYVTDWNAVGGTYKKLDYISIFDKEFTDIEKAKLINNLIKQDSDKFIYVENLFDKIDNNGNVYYRGMFKNFDDMRNNINLIIKRIKANPEYYPEWASNLNEDAFTTVSEYAALYKHLLYDRSTSALIFDMFYVLAGYGKGGDAYVNSLFNLKSLSWVSAKDAYGMDFSEDIYIKVFMQNELDKFMSCVYNKNLLGSDLSRMNSLGAILYDNEWYSFIHDFERRQDMVEATSEALFKADAKLFAQGAIATDAVRIAKEYEALDYKQKSLVNQAFNAAYTKWHDKLIYLNLQKFNDNVEYLTKYLLFNGGYITFSTKTYSHKIPTYEAMLQSLLDQKDELAKHHINIVKLDNTIYINLTDLNTYHIYQDDLTGKMYAMYNDNRYDYFEIGERPVSSMDFSEYSNTRLGSWGKVYNDMLAFIDEHNAGFIGTKYSLDDTQYKLNYTYLPKEIRDSMNVQIDSLVDNGIKRTILFNNTDMSIYAYAKENYVNGKSGIADLMDAYKHTLNSYNSKNLFEHYIFKANGGMDLLSDEGHIFYGMSDDEILDVINKADSLIVVAAIPNRHVTQGYLVEPLTLLSKRDLAKARKANAVIMPYELYSQTFDVLNNSVDALPKILKQNWLKGLALAFKVGYLTDPGTWFRNIVDSYLKAIKDTGDPIGLLKNTLTSRRMYSAYNETLNNIYKELGHKSNISTSDILHYFKVHETDELIMDKKQFFFIKDFIENGPSAGDVKASMQHFNNVKTAKNTLYDYELECAGRLLYPMSEIEKHVRFAEYLTLVNNGVLRSSAFTKVSNTAFNYSIRSNAAKFLDYIIPFYNFKKLNVIYWINTLIEHPEWLRYMTKYQNFAYNTFDINNEEEYKNNASLRYQVEAGNIALRNNTDANSFVLKLNPSFVDAINTFIAPLASIQDSIAAPLGSLYEGLMASLYNSPDSELQTRYDNLTSHIINADMLPIAGVLKQRYFGEESTSRKNAKRLEEVPFQAFLGRWLPGTFGSAKRWYDYKNSANNLADPKYYSNRKYTYPQRHYNYYRPKTYVTNSNSNIFRYYRKSYRYNIFNGYYLYAYNY